MCVYSERQSKTTGFCQQIFFYWCVSLYAPVFLLAQSTLEFDVFTTHICCRCCCLAQTHRTVDMALVCELSNEWVGTKKNGCFKSFTLPNCPNGTWIRATSIQTFTDDVYSLDWLFFPKTIIYLAVSDTMSEVWYYLIIFNRNHIHDSCRLRYAAINARAGSQSNTQQNRFVNANRLPNLYLMHF